jgi:hypothetical protein
MTAVKLFPSAIVKIGNSNSMMMKNKSYQNLGVTLIISFCIMYGVMFLNVARTAHIHLSITRTYMSLLMVCPMTVLMLVSMPMMYTNKSLNRKLILAAVVAFGVFLLLLRIQVPVTDGQYIRAMIPHHSSAIMTSSNADVKDPELKALARHIVVSQQQEIKQMELILERLDK